MKRFPALYLLTIFLLLPAFPILAQSDKQVNSHSFTYQYLTTKEGLSNQRVFSILEDKKGFIWISTRSGVDCFYGSIETVVRSFYRTDGTHRKRDL